MNLIADTHCLSCAGLLHEISGNFYNQTAIPALLGNEFQLTHVCEDEREIEYNNYQYSIAYKLYKWQSSENGTFIWFFIKGDIPHASNIIAAFGLPKSSQIPVYAMNLNLKLDLKTFSTILGYFGLSEGHNFFDTSIPSLKSFTEQPFFTQENPDFFQGIRSSFSVTKPTIDWACSIMKTTLMQWFSSFNSCTEEWPYLDTMIIDRYLSNLVDMHRKMDTVYDAIFGDKWLYTLFSKHIYQV